MKATLAFELPEDHEEYYTALHGENYRFAAEAMLEWVRTQRKYTTLHKEARAILDEAWDVFHRIVSDEGLQDG